MLAAAVLTELDLDVDISVVEGAVGELLDESVRAERYVIGASPTDAARRVDLSRIDFDALRERFEQGHKHTAAEKLKSSLGRRLEAMVQRNRTRMDFMETYQRMLDEYNTGAVNVDVLFDQLLALVHELDEEDRRGIAENLNEGELAIFDLLTRPDPGLTDAEREVVRKAARELLDTLRPEKLVLDWRRHQTTRAAVKGCIRLVLDKQLPPRYDGPLYNQKCEDVYQHVYEHYFGAGSSMYSVM